MYDVIKRLNKKGESNKRDKKGTSGGFKETRSGNTEDTCRKFSIVEVRSG